MTNVRVRRPASLATRVTLLTSTAIAVALLSFNWISVRSLNQHFVELDEQVISEVVQALIDELGSSTNDNEHLARLSITRDGVYYLIVDNENMIVKQSVDGPDLTGRVSMVSFQQSHSKPWSTVTWSQNGVLYRGVTLLVNTDRHTLGNPVRVVVAMDIDSHHHFLGGFVLIQWWTLCVALLISIVVAWLAVKWGLIPIRKANEEVQAITLTKLHVRLDPSAVPIELEETVASFNGALERIETGFAHLENYSADIAHELRTPVTNLTTQTEVIVSKERTIDEYKEVLYSNLDEFRRLNRMINDMLFLAQTANDPKNLARVQFDVAATIYGLFDYFEAWVEERGITLKLVGTSTLLWADREMIVRALSNLLSNAIRHTERGGLVAVELYQTGDTTVICIENSGAQIPSSDLPHIFDRFYRSRTRSKLFQTSEELSGVGGSKERGGAGLGLSIVKSIVDAHGGEVHVKSSDDRTQFELRIPNRN